MPDVNQQRFNERVKKIAHKADPNVRVERRVSKDGLVVEVARRKRKTRLIPYKSILIAATLFVTVKGFILAELGEAVYVNRIETMRSGSAGEIAAAFLLDMDPATKAIAQLLDRFVFE
ncbi:hypothetical protein KIN_24490 [Litoreibacter roseus]|uniref:Uncharacterized protein n=1 Tax=Litoreibacter roseus TaxID=2601869 RepID=A0A6N6JGY2_9RHOB|nr:hypothetical protein KIN_24490 [Litoreibacter roseus]